MDDDDKMINPSSLPGGDDQSNNVLPALASSPPSDGDKLAALFKDRPRSALARFCDQSDRSKLRRMLKRRLDRALRHSQRQRSTKLREDLRRGFLVTDQSDLYGFAPIHAAAMCGKKAPIAFDIVMAAVEKLPPRERDVDVRDRSGLTALTHAVLADWGDGVRKLVAAGADVSVPFCDRLQFHGRLSRPYRVRRQALRMGS